MPAKAVGTVFGAAENQCLIAALLQQMDEKVALPVMVHSMNAMRYGCCGAVWSRRLHLDWIDHEFDRKRSDRFGKVAEKSSVCRCFGSALRMRCKGGKNPMSIMRSASSTVRISIADRSTFRCSM